MNDLWWMFVFYVLGFLMGRVSKKGDD